MRPTPLLAAAALVTLAAQPAFAGDTLFGALARQAVRGVTSGSSQTSPLSDPLSVLAAAQAVMRTSTAPAQGPAIQTSLAAGSPSAAAQFAEPAPTNYSPREIKRPQDLRFSDEMLARKKALEQFGKAPCRDCEGGFGYDTSLRLLVPGWLRQDKAFEQKVGAMAAGDSFTWKGQVSTGLFTVVSEQPVGPFACKQVRYALTRGDKSADRLGLFCFGKREYSTLDEWIEVF